MSQGAWGARKLRGRASKLARGVRGACQGTQHLEAARSSAPGMRESGGHAAAWGVRSPEQLDALELRPGGARGGQEGPWGQRMNRPARYVRSLHCILKAVGTRPAGAEWEDSVIIL